MAKMNEEDVKKMEKELLSDIPANEEVELNWITAQINSLQEQRQILAAQFKMWKHMRDDKRMNSVADNLREVKSLLQYLGKEKTALEKKIEKSELKAV